MPAQFSSLNTNAVFAAIYNMIISQQVEVDNLGNHQRIVDDAKVDGGMYGDTKLFYATDVLKSHPWTGDSEASNLLSVSRPKAPKCQELVIDQFRQIDLTLDDYLTRQAWSDEGSFNSFNSVMMAWMGDTKHLYEATNYNCYLGTTKTTTGKQNITKTLTSGSEGKELATLLADLVVEMGDYSRDYNDYGFMRSYSPSDIKIIWNSQYVNKIKYNELPAVYHKDEIQKMFTNAESMPTRYFGIPVNSSNIATYSASTATTSKPLAGASAPYTYTPGSSHANGCIRTLVECDITVSNVATHLFPGDELPAGAEVVTTASTGKANLGEIYIESGVGGIDPIYCKVLTTKPKLMSGFEVGTSFFNPKSLTTNHYLTWGFNKLDYFGDKPFITIGK